MDYLGQKHTSKDMRLNTVLGDYRHKINEIIDDNDGGEF